MSRLLVYPLVLSLLPAALHAQQPGEPGPATGSVTTAPALQEAVQQPKALPDGSAAPSAPVLEKPVFEGKPVAGKIPGTECWIVHFKARPFDLEALYAEANNPNADATKYAAIVADLEQRMQAHQEPFVAAVGRLGGRVFAQWWLINGCAIEIAPAQRAAIEAMPNVAYLQPDIECFPVGRPAPTPAPILTATNASNHNADALQASGFRGTGVGCAIIDTGQDSNMNGIGRPHITYSKNGSTTTTRLVKNFQCGLSSPDDVHGHGTGVASIAAGYKWGSATADHGHANDANIAGYSIADNTGGGAQLSNMVTAYNTAVADRVAYNLRASNLSYTGSPNPASAEQVAADNACLADILVCTAAGNSSTNLTASQINLNGLTVGAVVENTKVLAGFSCRGFVQAGMPFPAICANGVSTNMALRNNEASDYIADGTSMASPQVCGAATQLRGRYTGLSALQTKAILLASAQTTPLTSSTQVSTGPGVGYLHNPSAHAIAGSVNRYGTATVTTASTTWTRNLPVVASTTYQVAIAWNRLNTATTSWSNLTLEIRNGAALVIQSAQTNSTLEFVRFTAPSTGNYTIRVIAAAFASGFTTQPFSWASTHDTNSGLTYYPGTFTTYGTGCKGSGGGGGTHIVVPSAYATKWGETANYYPHGRQNIRYQQVFLGSELGTNTLTGAAFRLDDTSTGPAGTVPISVWIGGTTKTPATLNTASTFAANFDSAAATLVFSGNWNFPANGPVNTDLTSFKPQIPFSTPYVFTAVAGRNLLCQIDQTGSGTDILNYFDCVTAGNTARVFATPIAATPTGVNNNYGLVMCFLSNASGQVLPKAFATAMGNSNNYYPWGKFDQHYQQIFDQSETTSATWNSISVRQASTTTGNPGGTQTVQISLGYSAAAVNALTTTFANNWISGTQKIVYSGNISIPTLSGTNTNPSTFAATWPFTTPFVHTAQAGRNLLLDVVNSSTADVLQFFDATSGGNTSRLFATPRTSATGSLGINYGVIHRFNGTGGGGGIPAVGNVGLPEINTGFQITLSNAKALTAAAIWMGFTQVNVPLPAAWAPGCTLWTTLDIFLLASRATDAAGNASVNLFWPNNTAFIGGKFYVEWFVVDPGQNKLGLVFSNAGAGVIGGYK